MATATKAPQNVQGSLFGLPDVTRPVEYRDNNDGLVTTLSQANQIDATSIIPFKQTDIALGWELEFQLTNTVTLAGGTLSTSQYFPYNFLGATTLNMQSQWNSIQWLSGIDGALFNAIRPMRIEDYNTVLYTNVPGMYSPAANLVSASNYTSASTAINLRYEMPVSIVFDRYYQRTAQGATQYVAPNAIVSPQFMAGSTRIVQPTVRFNAAYGATLDNSPFAIASGSPTWTGSNTLQVKRQGYYQPTMPNGADAPIIYPWQYSQRTAQRSLSGVSSIDLTIPFSGQILSLYVRLFDPAAASGKGAVISLSAVKECDLVYGSGLYRFQDRPLEMQARFIQQHGFFPTDGVIVWDLAKNRRGELTNQYALNTLTTSGVQVHIDFTGTQSSSAYAVIGVEGLTYVEPAS